MSTISVSPDLINWAIERSNTTEEALTKQFPKLNDWRSGARQPTWKQLQSFAMKTKIPFGYLFLETPPNESISIPDFRTHHHSGIPRPSGDVLDLIRIMERRQDWMREYRINQGWDALRFVGTVQVESDLHETADSIRNELGISDNWAEKFRTVDDAVRFLRNAIENVGILVSLSGVVGTNTNRKLDSTEFRGFVLSDAYAPFVFVNSSDAKTAQIFTLAHELVHIWLNRDGIIDLLDASLQTSQIEVFCNQVAAEILVPARLLQARWNTQRRNNLYAVAKSFKVSPLAAARRALDLTLITEQEFFAFYQRCQAEWDAHRKRDKDKSTGGDFYRSARVRIGDSFAKAVIAAAKSGTLLYRDAYQLTDLNAKSFERFAKFIEEHNG